MIALYMYSIRMELKANNISKKNNNNNGLISAPLITLVVPLSLIFAGVCRNIAPVDKTYYNSDCSTNGKDKNNGGNYYNGLVR